MRVHIESPQQVTLQLRRGEDTWVDECIAPCDKEIPLAREVRVKGWDGTSRSIVVAGPSGQTLVLDVEKRSTSAGGIVLGVLGGLFIVGGSIAIVPGIAALDAHGAEGPLTALGTLLVVGGFGAPFVAQGAAAQTNPKLELAKDMFRRGVALYELGQYDRALLVFQQSRDAFPSTQNTVDAAPCLDKLGRFDEALDMYEAALGLTPVRRNRGASGTRWS